MSLTSPAGWTDGEPPVIAQGILDGDAIVYELFPMQTVVFDANASSLESIPFPVFDTSESARGVLSMMVKSRSGFGIASRLRLRIQNAVQTRDEPATIFAEDQALVTIQQIQSFPLLATAPVALVGPSARLRVEFSPGTSTGVASATFALWLTLRRA